MSDPSPNGPPPGQFYRLAWIFYLLLGLAGVVWIGLRLGSIPLDLFLQPARLLIDLSLGIAVGGLLVGLWELARRWAPSARELEEEIRRMLGPLEPAEVVALAFFSGFAEEVFFRGALQGAVGWPLATLAFALLHTGPGRAFRIWTLFAALAGLAFAGLVEWRGALLPAIVAHVVVNAIGIGRLSRSNEESAAGDPDPSSPPGTPS